MKKKLVGILLAVIALSLGAGILTACAADKPTAQEGAVYLTESQTLYKVTGIGYLSFEYVPEPETPVEGEVYGNVFHVMATGSNNIEECTSWMSGTWALEEENGLFGTLTLIGNWSTEIDDPTRLDGAESGVAKEYELKDGEYHIGVYISGGGVFDFTLDPVKDKVGEGEKTPSEPEEPCTKHVDEDKDGKCDVCGEDVPTEQPSEVQVLLTAKASIQPYEGFTVNAEAKLELYTDETWAMSVKTDADPSNPDFAVAAGGTYTVDMTTYAMTLTVTEEAVEKSLPETFTVNCDISGYPELAYSAEVAYKSAGFTFDFVFTNAKEEPMVTLTGKASASPYEGYTVNAEAKLDLYENNTWVLLIKTDANPAQTDYQKAASGTWALDSATYVTTLTVTEQLVENSLPATFTIAADYSAMPTIGYSASITYTNMIAFTFALTGSMIMGV